MVHTIRLDHLEYKEAILDGPEFREKLRKHEKHISDTSKSIKILLKKFEDVITASEVLRNAQDSFSSYLKEFQLGFVGDTNEEESDIVDTLDSTYNLVQEIKEFSTKMINTGHALFRQLDNFRKEKLDNFKEKKKEYERQTARYCTVNEKFLTSSQSSRKDRSLLAAGNEDSTDFRDNDREVKEENQAFYRKCLEYILCIQEFEEKWFHFFAESIFAFIQGWTTFYHEGYEKHCDYETRLTKSNGGIQALRLNFDYFKSRSLDMIADILKSPEFHMNSFQTMSNEHFVPTSKQGYLYLIEKKTLGTSTRVKQFCKYYKETKRLEVIPFNQITNKMHPIEYYTVVSCQKSTSDKQRFVLDVALKEKNYANVHIYQALSLDDFKSWFAAMEGKELTPVLSPPYPLKNDPVYSLDRNGINFIRKCIKILEDEKINEEGIYRKNGVSHKINQFIERNFVNLASSTITPSSYSNSNSIYQNANDPLVNESSTSSSTSSSNTANSNSHHSLFSSVIKSTVNNFYLLSHSSSSSTLNASKNELPSSSTTGTHSSNHAATDSPSLGQHSSSTMTRNNSNTNLNNSGHHHHHQSTPTYQGHSNDLEDTCTITSALKHYLIHLKEPLMTYHFNQQFLNTCRKENLKDRIIEIHRLVHMLPPLNLEVLEALIKHLYKVSTHSSVNKMTASNLSTCFGPTIFRTEQECVSNLYNIKFYSEIIELLMIHHEKIFDKTLDNTFLNNLTPLKTPVTMTTGSMNILSPVAKNPSPTSGVGGGGGTSSSSSSIISSSTPNTKMRSTNSISLNPINRRAIYEPSYKNMLMNSSKTSVSSDSSQSDREHQLLSSSQNLNLGQLSSTLSSSLTYMSSQNIMRNANNTSASSSFMTPLKTTLTSPNTPAKAVTNGGTPSAGNKSSQQQKQQKQQPVKKPYNSQTGPFQRGDVADHQNKLNSSYSGNINNLSSSLSSSSGAANSNNKYSHSQTVTQFSVNNVNMNNSNNLSLSNSPNKSSPTNNNNNNTKNNVSSTSSPLNSKSTPSTATNTSTASLSLSLASSAVSPLTSLDGTKLKRARTLYPCEADNPSELSFDANVIIYNIRRSKESGWLEGTLNGKSGLVPGNYVQILDD